MKPLHLDFAPVSLQRTLSRSSAITWLLASGALTLWLFLVVDGVGLWQKHGADQASLQQLIARQRERLAKIPVVQKKVIPTSEITAVNVVSAQLNLPWRDLLDAVERATPPNIALLSLEPDAVDHTLKASAEAKDLDSMIATVESLQKQNFFSDVALVRHETNEADAHKPIRFQFNARWRGRSP